MKEYFIEGMYVGNMWILTDGCMFHMKMKLFYEKHENVGPLMQRSVNEGVKVRIVMMDR